MSHWEKVRRQARAWHDALAVEADGDRSAAALLDAAEHRSGVARVPVPAGDPLLDGADALLDAAAGVVIFASSVEPWRAAFYQAHEYAHLWLDGEHAACAGDDMELERQADAGGEDGPLLGAERVEGYGPRERREREANVFALELLLPSHMLRRWFLEDGLDAAAIAARTGLPAALVYTQLARAVLAPLPVEEELEDAPLTADPDLDAEQALAARVPHGPLLAEAGPGTGKTRTLVARILFLLEQGVPARSILTLTFSQAAAEELRERVATAAPEAARSLWLGTFHAFGLELLHKFGERLGLPPTPAVLDPTEALFWLERRLPRLPLRHYRNLHEPAHALRDMLAAISRAKDELAGPDEYATLAERMGATAATEQEREAAERALEVAQVYAFYQQELQQEGLLDFGDLVARAVALLRAHQDVRAMVQESYRHILVDEYQDVNRASGLLLREVAGDGAGLWVVGDARQAIYRFRGAAPSNMRLFATDFPGATTMALRHNYRSRPAIVAAVTQAATRMRTASAGPAPAWQSCRAEAPGELRLEIAEDAGAEAVGLARMIQEQRAQGRPYADQAVLCRSHGMLERLAAGLERAGVPVLRLGDVFERPEARDMLALLSLCAGDGAGLVRVAGFADYAIPLEDALALLALARQRELPFPRALALAREAPGLSPRGRDGLVLLARHLDGLVHGADAWTLLARYLFERSSYLRGLMGDGPAATQARLALHQFLEFVHDHRAAPGEPGDDPKATFLRYLRRVQSVGDERGARGETEWAGGIDAVRLLTIHAAKGLEFGAVYLPGLAPRYFPAPRRWQPCPPPPGLLTASDDDHDEEEECLFFVAISRARDLLCLSRARRYGAQGSKPSRLLDLLAGTLPAAPDGPITWPTSTGQPPDDEAPLLDDLEDVSRSFEVEELELYLDCPRRFYYEERLGLRDHGGGDAYQRTRRCVQQVLQWLQEGAAQDERGEDMEREAARRLGEVWQHEGPSGHAQETLYRQAAEEMLAHALSHLAETRARAVAPPRWAVPLAHGEVALRPQLLEVAAEGGETTVVATHLRTSAGDGGERQRRIVALYHAAAERAYPDTVRTIRDLPLASGAARDLALRARDVSARLAQYDAAMAGIRRGRFGPRPDERRCPRCPHYFICPTGDGLKV